MADAYRAYSPSWDFIGHSATPQYPGQSPLRDGTDFGCCPCGKPMGRYIGINDEAWCAAGHQLVRQKVIVDG